MIASENNCLKSMELLLHNGADPNLQDDFGTCSYHRVES
jgi:ankyrin repeat protein